MNNHDLRLLQKAHAASGKLLAGEEPEEDEEAALGRVIKMVAPVLLPVKKSHVRDLLREIAEISEPHATRWTPATPASCPSGGHFFR